MEKQTAVEFLESTMTEYLQRIYKSYIEEAKEMEKQQIIDANMAGQKFIGAVPGHYKNDAEQYYNLTFKQN
jgi:hypothetical protein